MEPRRARRPGKNPQYFKPGLPYLDKLEFRIMKDPLTASTALRAGEIDFIARVPIQQVLVLEKSPGIHLAHGPFDGPHRGPAELAGEALR